MCTAAGSASPAAAGRQSKPRAPVRVTWTDFPVRMTAVRTESAGTAGPAGLAARPNLLVLDEPTAGVDAVATHALLEFISQIHEERKLTVLLVTHDLPIVRKHAQHVVWLHEGTVLHGTVAEIFTPERLAEIFEMEVG